MKKYFLLSLYPILFFMFSFESQGAAMNQNAIFAMGCFWCGETAFKDHDTNTLLPGIVSVRVGYAGGTKAHPTYEDHEGYKEAVKVTFDPSKISYSKILDIFWRNVDPLDAKGQFCDKGFAYTSAIFYENEAQKKESEESLSNIEKKLNQKPLTELIQATSYFDAEDYHQDYKSKNPIRYKFYRWNCGRDKRLQEIWGH